MMQHPLSRRSVMASALALTACGPQPAGTANDLRIARELDGIIGADWPDQGLSGNGIRIGIIDAGFGNFRSDPFTRALDVETIRDFVPGERPAPFESADRHGTQMAQFIGGRDGRRLRGLAHRAQYLLAIGEDQSTEPRRDEDGVIAALDWLVSEGVKLVNISLGYTRFDDASPYAPGMMDGRTARISRHLSALLEADPMLVAVVSAGNQGRSDWQFVTSPGDVEDAITVGSARGAQPERRPTSGIGNPDMAFIKPDLVARSGGGASSVATAIVTGLVACLREQYPEADPMLVAVVSAGNQGRSDWQFVTSPGDVEDAITVGSARGAQPERRPTSGIGNPDMAFIKPDLVARSGGGASSVATAIVTGLVACLREQYPEAGRALIAEALRRTASAASTPDRLIGHGVPDAQAALDWLSQR